MQSQEGEKDTAGVSLVESAEYTFSLTYTANYSSHDLNLTDPEGAQVSYHFISETVDRLLISGRFTTWVDIYTSSYGFNSTASGTYTFWITGYFGRPFVYIQVVKVEPPQQPPSQALVYAGTVLEVLGIIALFRSEGAFVVGILMFFLACVFFLMGGIAILSYTIVSRMGNLAQNNPYTQYQVAFGIVAGVTFIIGLVGGISARLKKHFKIALAGASMVLLSSILNAVFSTAILSGIQTYPENFMLANMIIVVLSVLTLAMLVLSRREFPEEVTEKPKPKVNLSPQS
jgi:hypothetical protein